MKDCYAVRLIRYYNTLPDTDTRSRLLKLWHRLCRQRHYTKEQFHTDHPEETPEHCYIKNRHAWTQEELGYE